MLNVLIFFQAQTQYLERIQRGRQNIIKNTVTEDMFPLILHLNIEWNDIGREVKQHQFKKVQQVHQKTILYKIKLRYWQYRGGKCSYCRRTRTQNTVFYKDSSFSAGEKVFVQSNWRLQTPVI